MPDRLYTMHNQLISQLVYFLLGPGNGETREACMVVCKRRRRGRRITGQRCLCARRPAKGVLHTYINLVYLLVYVPLCTTRTVLPTATHHSPPSTASPRYQGWTGLGGSGAGWEKGPTCVFSRATFVGFGGGGVGGGGVGGGGGGCGQK